MSYTVDFTPVLNGLPDLLLACLGTFNLAFWGILLATLIGVGGFLLRSMPFAPARWSVMCFVEVVRNTPFLVQIYFVYFALPFIGVRLDPTPTAIIALGINGGAFAIEIIRGGVQSIDRGQVEAGLSLGLSKGQVFRFVVMQPAFRAIFPSLTSQFIFLTLTTSICSTIAAYELTSVAQRIESESYRSFEVYAVVTLLYLATSWGMAKIFALISRRYFSYPVK